MRPTILVIEGGGGSQSKYLSRLLAAAHIAFLIVGDTAEVVKSSSGKWIGNAIQTKDLPNFIDNMNEKEKEKEQ